MTGSAKQSMAPQAESWTARHSFAISPHVFARGILLEHVAIKADCIRNDGHSWRILQE
jgi:hypothetical protein